MNSDHPTGAAPLDVAIVYHDICDLSVPQPAVARGWLHGRMFTGPWDATRLGAHMGAGLWLSFHAPHNDSAHGDDPPMRPTTLAGDWPDGGFVELTICHNTDLEDHARYQLRVFADTPARAVALLDRLRAGFLIRTAPTASGPRIGLLNVSYSSLEVQRVHITEKQIVPREHVDLFYGDGASAWIDAWIARLDNRRYGLSLLSGDPGTGKTTLLRSLAAWLGATHLLYFIPAARFGNIDAGELVTFWAGENRLSKLRKILVLEDAESVLLRRDGDNRERVATLLNLTDGIMGDALGLQVVCTLNSDLTEIDPALLRPGRLLARREFRRLTGAAAARLAAHLGRPELAAGSVSLAEIFNPPDDAGIAAARPARRHIGFSASARTI